jgi:hypothetical protein
LGAFDPIVIARGDTRRLDLCYTVEGSTEFRLAVPRGPHGIKTDFGPGVYKVRISVDTPDHPVSADGAFFIVHPGGWQTTSVHSDTPEFVASLQESPAVRTILHTTAGLPAVTDVRSLGSRGTDKI